MTADQRLTLDQCVPGLRVRCVDARGLARGHLQLDAIYVVTGHNKVADVFLSGSNMSWLASRFVLADPPPPVLTEELRAALVGWYDHDYGAATPYWRLRAAIEATPDLLPDPAPPTPGTTDAALPAMYCGADAFEGEG